VNQTMTVKSGSNEFYYNMSYFQAGNYSFSIFARDEEGNTDVSLGYWFMVANFEQSFNFFKGWNLVTIPLAHQLTASTLGGAIDSCTVICRFNASSQSWVTHVVGIPYNDFPIIDGLGYFVYVNNNSILNVTGYPLESVTVSIDAEWNLIGWYHDSVTSAASLGENITDCTTVCKFNATSQSWVTHVMGIPYNDFFIERGMALFIYATTESTWQGEG
jgi:hypothetical protein